MFLPAWYPTAENPVAGIFIKEHAKAVSLYNDVIVLYRQSAARGVKGFYGVISDQQEDGIRTIRIKYKKSLIPKTSFLSTLCAFRKLLKQRWRPDIIHAHVYSAGVSAVILGKIYKIPVVVTEHWTGFLRRALRKLDILRTRFAMNSAKIILPVSKDLEEAIRFYGVKNRFEIVPNAVNTEIFCPPLQKATNGRKKLLLVSVLSHQKGISYLLRALVRLKRKRQDFVLDMVGDGPKRLEYEHLAKKLGLTKMVHFHGLKTQKQVADFMKKCDFFVQPSLYETFGVTYTEAMACGKPLVATDIPVLKEKITQDTGILVPPKDVKALAEAIDYALDHYQENSPEKISQFAKNKFSYVAVGKKLDHIYREVLHSYESRK